jgi:hypothetical protein
LAVVTRKRERAPFVEWSTFAPLFARRWRQGDHVTVLGPTGSGKTTLAVELLDAREHVLALITKPEDPIVDEFTAHGFRVSKDLDIRVTDGTILDRRFAFWPVKEGPRRGERYDLDGFRRYQRRAVLAALTYVWRTRRWCIFLDEGLWIASAKGGLGLDDELDTLLYTGKTAGITVVVGGQRPAWLPRSCYSSADHLFFFATSDGADLERLADIGAGVDRHALEEEIVSLPPHDFAYLSARVRPPLLVRSRVEL